MTSFTSLITAKAFAKMAGLNPPENLAFHCMFSSKESTERVTKVNELCDLYAEAYEKDEEANNLYHEFKSYCMYLLWDDCNFQDQILKAIKEADNLDSAILKAKEIRENAKALISKVTEHLEMVHTSAEKLTTWIMDLISKQRPEGKHVLVLKCKGMEPTDANRRKFYDSIPTLTPEDAFRSISKFQSLCYVPVWIGIHAKADQTKLKEYIAKKGFWIWASDVEDGKMLEISWE